MCCRKNNTEYKFFNLNPHFSLSAINFGGFYNLEHISVQVRAFLQPPMQGVVLETYGSGNAPDNRPDLLAELKAATDSGVIIVNCTQCLRGTVSASYATGKVYIFSFLPPNV